MHVVSIHARRVMGNRFAGMDAREAVVSIHARRVTGDRDKYINYRHRAMVFIVRRGYYSIKRCVCVRRNCKKPTNSIFKERKFPRTSQWMPVNFGFAEPSAKSDDQRIDTWIDCWLCSIVNDFPFIFIAKVIVAQAIRIGVANGFKGSLQGKPLRPVHMAFENGVLNPDSPIRAFLCNAPEASPASGIDGADIVANEHQHKRIYFIMNGG